MSTPYEALTVALQKPTRRLYSELGTITAVDYEIFVMEACALLEQTDCRFHMGGFGTADWNLDVGYDMSAVLEQVPKVLSGLRARLSVDLDLYSQGVERTLSFTPAGERFRVRCVSGTSWSPSPSEIVMERAELISLFEKLAADFAEALAFVAPMAPAGPARESP